MVWDEFRDGNVPPSFRNQEALGEAIRYLNTELGLTDVWVRSDAAACQQDLLETLATCRPRTSSGCASTSSTCRRGWCGMPASA